MCVGFFFNTLNVMSFLSLDFGTFSFESGTLGGIYSGPQRPYPIINITWSETGEASRRELGYQLTKNNLDLSLR